MVMGQEDPPSSGSRAMKMFSPPRGSASVHLDALRGLAAISVMYSHWWDAFYANYDTLPHNPLLSAAYCYSQFGHAWVIVFFVLSGYLVGGSVLRAVVERRWSWRSYLLIRCTRIYVVLVPALLLGGTLDWAGMHQSGADLIYTGHSGMGALYYNVYSSLTPTAFVESLIFWGLGAPGFGSNGPLWSLSLEFWYYMAFPFLVFALYKTQRHRARTLNALALLAWAAFVGGYTVSLFPVWLAGVIILFLPRLPQRSPWNRKEMQFFVLGLSTVLLLAGFVLKAQGLLFPDSSVTVGRSHWHPPISDLLLSPLVILLVWAILNCCTRTLSGAYVWLAKRAADSSYTLYLVHVPALVFLKAFLHLPRVAPTWQSLPFHLSLFLVVFAYAQLAYWLFEKNTDRVRAWLKPFVMGRSHIAGEARPLESSVG